MKTLFLLLSIVLMTATVASADDFMITSDTNGTNCHFSSGFHNGDIYVVHRFSSGTTGSIFKVTLPAGSAFLAFQSPYQVLFGSVVDPGGIALNYQQCLSGSFVVGNITAILTAGTMAVAEAAGHPYPIYADCASHEEFAFGQLSYVDMPNIPCYNIVANEASTWGSVKSLYR